VAVVPQDRLATLTAADVPEAAAVAALPELSADVSAAAVASAETLATVRHQNLLQPMATEFVAVSQVHLLVT